MKGPSRKDDPQQPKCVKPLKPKTATIPLSYDEAKASCKARKRKERQESISSLCQERKVIRSNSEERPTQKKHLDSIIRRVSSSEDFRKNDQKPLQFEKGTDSARHSPDIVLIYDEDCEHERRRCHERFSKPLALKSSSKKKKGKRPKLRCPPKQTRFKPQDAQVDAQADTFLQMRLQERSPSPVQQLDLDLTTLHEQVDCSEPLLSCANHTINENTETMPGLSVASNRLLSSPRNSIIATHRIYLDPDIQQQASFTLDGGTQNPLELRLQKITKQINSIKKKIKRFEIDFETKNGYKVSHADKLNDKNVRKLYLELSKLKKEQKQVVEVCPGEEQPAPKEVVRNFQDTIQEIEKKLLLKRDVSKRPNLLEKMTSDELLDEKVAVQKALLYLESIHGRPDNKEDRNLARPIYDRYRSLKRMLSKVQNTSSGNELATIHEDETMSFISSSTPQQISEIDSEKSSIIASTDSSDTETTSSTSISENLHSLTKNELIAQHRIVTEEKKDLRRTIKMFELEIQKKTGRIMMQKEDKLPIEHVYTAYKKVKAKLKLLDALVGKQL